jgi:uncharacterized membrane protein
MKIKQSVVIQLGMFAVAALYSLYFAARMPDTVPIHWNAAGQVDGYGSKWTGLFMQPGVSLMMILLTVALPKLSPRKFEIEPFEHTYSYIMVLVGALMLCLHVAVVQAAAGTHLDMSRVLFAVLFAFFGLMGNVMGKVKQNFYMGIRTPWTLADERVWHSTHRFGGRIWLAGGAIGMVASLAGLPFSASITYLLIIAFIPVLYSYFAYQKLPKDSEA